MASQGLGMSERRTTMDEFVAVRKGATRPAAQSSPRYVTARQRRVAGTHASAASNQPSGSRHGDGAACGRRLRPSPSSRAYAYRSGNASHPSRRLPNERTTTDHLTSIRRFSLSSRRALSLNPSEIARREREEGEGEGRRKVRHARAHTHTHTHARTFTHAHTLTHTHTRTYTHTHARTHAHTYRGRRERERRGGDDGDTKKEKREKESKGMRGRRERESN